MENQVSLCLPGVGQYSSARQCSAAVRSGRYHRFMDSAHPHRPDGGRRHAPRGYPLPPSDGSAISHGTLGSACHLLSTASYLLVPRFPFWMKNGMDFSFHQEG